MSKDLLEVGKTYLINHTSGRIQGRILSIDHPQSYASYGKSSRTLTRYTVLNLNTNREITIKSSVKFLQAV